MFRRRPTRPRPTGPYNQDATLCGRHVGPKRLCAKPATWHALIASPLSRTGFIGASACDEHREGIIPTPLDFHPLEPICLEDGVWWNRSQGTRPGFCYHPEEHEALMAELTDIKERA